MKEDNQFDVPFQVANLINSLRDRKERVYIRGNYRSRLEGIKTAIDKAIAEYDVEMGNIHPPRFKKGQR